MNYEEKIKELEKDNGRVTSAPHIQSNGSFAIAYALLAVADAITKIERQPTPHDWMGG